MRFRDVGYDFPYCLPHGTLAGAGGHRAGAADQVGPWRGAAPRCRLFYGAFSRFRSPIETSRVPALALTTPPALALTTLASPAATRARGASGGSAGPPARPFRADFVRGSAAGRRWNVRVRRIAPEDPQAGPKPTVFQRPSHPSRSEAGRRARRRACIAAPPSRAARTPSQPPPSSPSPTRAAGAVWPSPRTDWTRLVPPPY